MNPKLNKVFTVFFQVFPTNEHFFDNKVLKPPFTFLKTPEFYHKEYIKQCSEKTAIQLFIHNFGRLIPLSKKRQRYTFWRNLYGEPTYLAETEGSSHFGYLPYFIPSNWQIKLHSPSKRQEEEKLVKNTKFFLFVRLYPLGISSIHLYMFLKPNTEINLEEFNILQKLVMRRKALQIFRKSGSSTIETIDSLFKKCKECVYQSIYTQQPKDKFRTRTEPIHRAILPYFDKIEKTSVKEVKDNLAALIMMKKPRGKEAATFLKLNFKGKEASPDELIVFHPQATVFHVPTCSSNVGYCLWNNYTNVVELLTIKNLNLSYFQHYLEEAFMIDHELDEFLTAIDSLDRLRYSSDFLKGGHYKLYKCINQRLELENKDRKVDELKRLHKEIKPLLDEYKSVNSQLTSIETILSKIQMIPIFYVIYDLLLNRISDDLHELQFNIFNSTKRYLNLNRTKISTEGHDNVMLVSQQIIYNKLIFEKTMKNYSEEFLLNFESFVKRTIELFCDGKDVTNQIKSFKVYRSADPSARSYYVDSLLRLFNEEVQL